MDRSVYFQSLNSGERTGLASNTIEKSSAESDSPLLCRGEFQLQVFGEKRAANHPVISFVPYETPPLLSLRAGGETFAVHCTFQGHITQPWNMKRHTVR